jgi:pimeloyl-ACP methyl ester carboxylesterase
VVNGKALVERLERSGRRALAWRATLLGVTLFVLLGAQPMWAQDAEDEAPVGRQAPVGPVQGAAFKTQYIRLGSGGDGLLYEPMTPGPNARFGVVFSHPGNNNFNASIGREMASRGFRVLNVNYRGAAQDMPDAPLPTISQAVAYLRSLPGVQRVVVAGHSGGGREMTMYQNIAENGVRACMGAEKLYPCTAHGLATLQKADGVILLDSPPGALHNMSSIDPAVDGPRRIAELDMFTAANGFDAKAGKAQYSSAFAKRFYAAQSARNTKLINQALERLRAIKAGKGEFTDDEPLVIKGMGINAVGARLYQPDIAFAARSKRPHLLLKADGSQVETIISSVRPPSARGPAQLGSLSSMTQNTTVRSFLAHSTIRTNADFAFTADDITGVDWRSSIDSAPGNAEGITVPTLVLTNSCHYLIVPGEIIFDHLAAKDKTFVAVEGATHGFSPCRPEYGDTTKRAFDFVASWLNKSGRF